MEIERKEAAYFLAVFLLTASAAFLLSQKPETGEAVELGVEVNSSAEMRTVEFFNHSVDLFHENGLNATFYLDRDRDGSSDMVVETVPDGKVHRRNLIIDFPDGVYLLEISYRDAPGKEEDAWLRAEKATRLG